MTTTSTTPDEHWYGEDELDATSYFDEPDLTDAGEDE
jgi:hypothetical protein